MTKPHTKMLRDCSELPFSKMRSRYQARTFGSMNVERTKLTACRQKPMMKVTVTNWEGFDGLASFYGLHGMRD